MRQFAVDFSLVVLSVRCAYLVDAIILKEPLQDFDTVLQRLRDKDSSKFCHVSHWYEISSQQSFVVNVPLFEEMYKSYRDRLWTTFVQLDDIPIVLDAPPTGLCQVLDEFHSVPDLQSALSMTLPSGLTQQTLVCLAGLLIDYPIAYVPRSQDQTSFLSNIPLDIYEVILEVDENVSRSEKQHTVLKFTCPSMIGNDYIDLSPSQMTNKLRRRYCSRLAEIGLASSILHHVDTFDRVAL